LRERGSARGDYKRSGLAAMVDLNTAASMTLQREGVDEWSRGVMRRVAAHFARSWREVVARGKRGQRR
jgi:hypothetical protein